MSVTRLELIIGPMFSGKSTELITRVERYKYTTNFKRILLINHSSDNRQNSISGEINGESVQTHSGKTMDAIKTDKLMKVFDIAIEHDVIGIDEAQFFGDLIAFFKSIEPHNKVVIVAGLDGDVRRNPMGQILSLIPYANKVEKITAIDTDGTDAIFTKRRQKSDKIIDIGGCETYMAVSRKNFPDYIQIIKESPYSFFLNFFDIRITSFSETVFELQMTRSDSQIKASFQDGPKLELTMSNISNDRFEFINGSFRVKKETLTEFFMFLLQEISNLKSHDEWKKYLSEFDVSNL